MSPAEMAQPILAFHSEPVWKLYFSEAFISDLEYATAAEHTAVGVGALILHQTKINPN